MEPSEIRSRILGDHERLRGDLDRLEALVGDARAGSAARASLLIDTEALLARLRAHMHWEESYLLPALREADAWGAERAEQLTRDHREQSELLDFLNVRLREQARPIALLVREVEQIIELLRNDIRQEEAELLDERVLRDDIVAIDVQTG
jgi:iron-sulfur cluster repair protein YtfE (RIC family)